jgi:hypothetical protein
MINGSSRRCFEIKVGPPAGEKLFIAQLINDRIAVDRLSVFSENQSLRL